MHYFKLPVVITSLLAGRANGLEWHRGSTTLDDTRTSTPVQALGK